MAAVTNPLSNLGPAPRMVGAGAGGGTDWFTPPAGSGPSPGNFPTPSQPVAAPQQPFQSPAPGFQGGASGNMQAAAAPNFMSGISMFTPSAMPASQLSYDDDIENEPPLLEELGINIEHIILRIKGIAFFKKIDEAVLEDADLSGPLLIGLALGACNVLAGKLQIGYIWGFFMVGCVSIYMLINVMSQRSGIDLYRTASILGYGLIPIVLLAFVGIFISLKCTFGLIAAMASVFWATATTSKFFETAISMKQQRWLVAYPVCLVYTAFTMLSVF